MHLLAEKVILQHLIALGLVKDFPLAELQEKRVGAIFFPHGLGHLIVFSFIKRLKIFEFF